MIFHNIGNCHSNLGNYSDALTFFKRALDIRQNTVLIPDKNRRIAMTLVSFGNCHIDLCNYADALTFLNRALDIFQNTAFNLDKDSLIAFTRDCIKKCHNRLFENFDDSRK